MHCLKALPLVFFIFISFVSFSQSFERIFNSTYLGKTFYPLTNTATTQLSNGGYLNISAVQSIGPPFAMNILYIRLNDQGDTLWTKEVPHIKLQNVKSLIQDDYGNIVLTGTQEDPATNWGQELYIMKTDTLGNLLNYRQITSSGNCCWDLGKGYIRNTADSKYLIGSHHFSSSSNYGYVHKIDTNLNTTIWTYNFWTPFEVYNMREFNASVLTVGRQNVASYYGRFTKVTHPSSSTGYFIKNYFYQGGTKTAFYDVVDYQGGYLVLGGYEDAAAIKHTFLMRTNANGDSLQTYPLPGNIEHLFMEKTANNELILFGNKRISSTVVNFHVTKLDANLNIQLSSTYQSALNTPLYTINLANDGGYVLTGLRKPTSVTVSSIYILKIDSNCCVSPTANYNSSTESVNLCLGESLLLDGNVITSAGTYTGMLQTTNGCDSAVTWVVSVFPNPMDTTILNQTICANDSLLVGSTYFSQPGNFSIVLPNVHGCDSTIILNLTVLPVSSTILTDSICSGSSYTLGSNVYSTSGSYSVLFQSIQGCDSLVILNLTVMPVDAILENLSICEGDSISFQGNYYHQTGTYSSLYTNVYGCDSTHVLNLQVNSLDSSYQTLTICEGDSINFAGNVYAQQGVFPIVFTNASGCDSIHILTINLTPIDSVFQSINLCSGDTLLIENSLIFNPGSYVFNFNSTSGCDSIVTLTVQQHPVDSVFQQVQICSPSVFYVGNHSYSFSGMYIDTLLNGFGCDSIIVTDLTVHALPEIMFPESIQLCEGDTAFVNAGDNFVNYLWNTGDTTQVLSTSISGQYEVSVTDTNGCQVADSLVVSFSPCANVIHLKEDIEIVVFPNPTTGKLNITTTISGLQFDVWNDLGQRLIGRRELMKSVTLELKTRGNYTLRFYDYSGLVHQIPVVMD